MNNFYIKQFLLGCLFIIGVRAQSDEKIYNLDEEIVVTASQIPTAFANVARSIAVLQKQDIQSLPVQTVQDAIEYLAGVDVQQRSPNGIQSDVSIRGATYEQTLVLIDGVKINDSQTGHHNMNIPLTLADIERIEVLKGPGSKQFGPNAIGGVINIITGHSPEKKVTLFGTMGQNRFYEGGISINMPTGRISNRVSVSQSGSDGYRENTDFINRTVSYGSAIIVNPQNKLDLLAAFNEKEFGANGFYSPDYPEQWEKTRTLFLKSGWQYKNENYHFKAGANFRRNEDEFLLVRNDPDFYKNEHETIAAAFDLLASAYNSYGITTLSIEYGLESITSNNLGEHQRHKTGLYLEHQLNVNKFALILAGSFYQVSDWGWNAWPGVDFRYNLNANSNFYASLGRAFRVPTFTELYYLSPSSRGNPNLREEQAWVYELGYGYSVSGLRIQLAAFQRDGKDQIDWIWSDVDNIWQAKNWSQIQTRGIETGMDFQPVSSDFFGFIKRVNLQYTYLNSSEELKGFISKYALNHLRHHLVAGVTHSLFVPDLQVAWKLRWEDRLLYDQHFLTDLRVAWKKEKINLNLDILNIWDRQNKDYFQIPLPSRWIKIGLQWDVL